MKYNLKLLLFSFVYLLNAASFLQGNEQPKKIVGLIQVRNEETYIKQCLNCLTPYVDALIILDDASTDKTINIIKALQKSLPIKVIIENEKSAWQTGNESENKQKLLDAGRSIGGTHFICIDADEIFTANCMENNYLRNQILALKPGQSRTMRWIQLWHSTDQFNATHISKFKPIIFCDNGKAEYSNTFLHGCNLPQNLEPFSILDTNYGLMHFQFVNWRNLLIKQAWYRCLERIRNPQKPIDEINALYGNTVNVKNIALQPCPKSWFEGYTLFNPSIYKKPIVWREEQVLSWFDKYGQDFFKDLEIWNIDWGEELSYPRLLIKIPTRSRPVQFFEQLDRYYQKLSGKAPYLFLISCDIDDMTMNNQEIEEKLKSYPHLHYRFNANNSKIEAYNANIDEFIDQFDILIVTSDDLEPMIQNYDLLIIKEMNKHFPQLDGVLNFSDGRDVKEINPYPILGINYYRQFNYIYYPEYKSFFCDNELADVSNSLKKEVYFSTTLFKHNMGWDWLYAKNQKFWNSDQSLYERRKLKNFYLNVQEINNEP